MCVRLDHHEDHLLSTLVCMDVFLPPQQLPDEGATISDVKPLLLVNNLVQILFQLVFRDLVTINEAIGIVELVILHQRDLH